MTDQQNSEKPDTEMQILQAAARVFVKKGRHAASMQDIADEAGINRTLLHYYFRNKEKLFDRVFLKVFPQMFPSVVRAMESGAPLEERLSEFVRIYSGILKDNPHLPVFVLQELTINPDRLANMMLETGFNTQKTISMFSKDLENYGLADVDPRHIMASIMGMVLFPYIGRPLFQTLAFGGDAEAYEKFLEEREKHIPLLLSLILTGADSLNKENNDK